MWLFVMLLVVSFAVFVGSLVIAMADDMETCAKVQYKAVNQKRKGR